MAEYSSLKVPELKKLLAEKGLPQTGNKADLIARLQENDQGAAGAEAAAPVAAPATEAPKPEENKEDEITYSDDETAKPAEAPAAAPPADAPAPTENGGEAKPATAEATETPATTEEKPAEKEPVSYAIGLSSTTAEEEAKKRADRAKRFGIEEDEDAKKRAERAERFGIDQKELASGLDSALPERALKRGRGRDVGDGARPGKRQSLDRRGGGRRRGGGGAGGRRDDGGDAPVAKSRGILDDPAEKAKAEKRAARFASS